MEESINVALTVEDLKIVMMDVIISHVFVNTNGTEVHVKHGTIKKGAQLLLCKYKRRSEQLKLNSFAK